jgi:hypothetical protein
VDPPLRPGGSLSIGYGAGGSPPFTFRVDEGQALDVGFLKLFLTTEYVNFSNIAQVSPFERESGRKPHRVQMKCPQLWDTILIPLVQRKK